MFYIDHRDKFLSKQTDFEIDNPEILTRNGFNYYFLIENEETMNDKSYVDDIINQAILEDINFIILFENKEKLKHEFTNLLMQRILTSNMNLLLSLCYYNEESGRYEYFKVKMTKEGKFICSSFLQ